MNKFWMLIVLPSLVSVITACGGGTEQNQEQGQSQKNKVPTNANQVISGKEFLALTTNTNNTNCSNTRNRLYIIDKQYVLWDKAGSCPNASYEQTLFGATPTIKLCSNIDSIAGPQFSCPDSVHKSLFTTIISNLEKSNLGLDQTHQVQLFATTSGTLASVNFNAINAGFYRGSAPANIVIKDKSAWDNFWINAQIQAPVTSLWNNYFYNTMVLGVFYKTPNDCSITNILKLVSNGQKLVADYIEEERVAITRCDPNPLASTPMSLIETTSLDLPIEFSNVSNHRIAYETIDETQFSTISTAKNIVIKDQSAWQKIWEEYKNNNSVAPTIDFNKNMLIAIFTGNKSCFGIDSLNIWNSNNKVNVAYHNPLPGPATICTAVVLKPATIVQIPRSELGVEFTATTIYK